MSTQQEKTTTRKFSKKITVWSLVALFGIAIIGLFTGNPSTHEIISALGPWVLGLLMTYMAIGYGDHRLSKSMPNLTDLFMNLVNRGRGSKPHRDDSEGGPDGTLH